jgi:hypothetical protein
LPVVGRRTAIGGTWAITAECIAKRRPASTNYNHEIPFSPQRPP